MEKKMVVRIFYLKVCPVLNTRSVQTEHGSQARAKQKEDIIWDNRSDFHVCCFSVRFFMFFMSWSFPSLLFPLRFPFPLVFFLSSLLIFFSSLYSSPSFPFLLFLIFLSFSSFSSLSLFVFLSRSTLLFVFFSLPFSSSSHVALCGYVMICFYVMHTTGHYIWLKVHCAI